MSQTSSTPLATNDIKNYGSLVGGGKNLEN